MSEKLDFSELTDDQLVELAHALAHEALCRSPAMSAAFNEALLTEKERAEAAIRGAKIGRERVKKEEQEIHRRAAEEQAAEELRQKRNAALASLLRRGAQIVCRDVSNVTLVWGAHYGTKTRLLLNPGTSTAAIGALHLVEYEPDTQSIRTSWALEKHKAELLLWATETSAALRALGVHNVNVKGIEL